MATLAPHVAEALKQLSTQYDGTPAGAAAISDDELENQFLEDFDDGTDATGNAVLSGEGSPSARLAAMPEDSYRPATTPPVYQPPAYDEAQYRIEEAARIRQQNQALLEQNMALQAQLQGRFAPEQQAPAYDDSDIQLTPEEEQTFGASATFVNKMVERRIRALERTRLSQLEQQFNQTHEQLVRTSAQTTQEIVAAQVRASVPDFDARISSPGWKNYLLQAAPLSGGRKRLADILDEAVKTGNAVAAKEIVMGYNLPTGAPQATVTPGKAQATTPQTLSPKGRRVAYSKYAEADRRAQRDPAYFAGDFQKVKSLFLRAAAEGRVNYSA